MAPWHAHLWYGVAWVLFAICHSLLADDWAKSRLHAIFGKGYRLFFNALASIMSIGLIAAAWFTVGFKPFDLSLVQMGFFFALFVAGMWIGRIGFQAYDTELFLGTRQLREGVAEDDEPFKTDGLLCWIRHPLYTATFLLLWSLAFSEVGLATALWGSLYTAIGARLEERRLLRQYGDAYADYRRRVPAFIPWKGRVL